MHLIRIEVSTTAAPRPQAPICAIRRSLAPFRLVEPRWRSLLQRALTDVLVHIVLADFHRAAAYLKVPLPYLSSLSPRACCRPHTCRCPCHARPFIPSPCRPATCSALASMLLSLNSPRTCCSHASGCLAMPCRLLPLVLAAARRVGACHASCHPSSSYLSPSKRLGAAVHLAIRIDGPRVGAVVVLLVHDLAQTAAAAAAAHTATRAVTAAAAAAPPDALPTLRRFVAAFFAATPLDLACFPSRPFRICSLRSASSSLLSLLFDTCTRSSSAGLCEGKYNV